MSFELEKNERIPKGIRRIVRKRIEKAERALSDTPVSDAAIHEARRRFKQIRGTLRLVRSELGEKIFQKENRAFRNAARPLSSLRDTRILPDTLDHVLDQVSSTVKRETLASLKCSLVKRHMASRRRVLQNGKAHVAIVHRIRAARKRLRQWPLQRRGWKAIKGGLRKVYRRGRRAERIANTDSSDATLHELRKRTKDLRYELELIQHVRPRTMKVLVKRAHDLTDLLGEDHDLAVLHQIALDHANKLSSAERELLSGQILKRRAALQRDTRRLSQDIYDQRVRKYMRRVTNHAQRAWL